jgi:gluconokinase
LEAVALRLAAAARALIESRDGRARLVASGRAFVRPELVQIVADALGRPIGLTRDTDASSRGAAIVALERIGALRSIELELVARTFRPRRAMRGRYEWKLERQAPCTWRCAKPVSR